MTPPHAHWQLQYLHAAGFPAPNGSVGFLTFWNKHANTSCDYNAVDLTHREPGSTRCKLLGGSRYARNYTDTASSAAAFAAQLTKKNYPTMYGAFKAGDPWDYESDATFLLEMVQWGSTRFQQWMLAQASGAPDGSGAGQKAPAAKTKNVSGAWSHLMKVLARDGHATIVELNRSAASMRRIERRLRRV